ncbi:hypothetical protein J9T78_004420 [Salmonella enterica]|nr:hypothetical protein [Salmonella enterica]EHO4426055.1 hypothetical protein [Salmonella enterica]
MMTHLKCNVLVMVVCWLLTGCSTGSSSVTSIKKPVEQKAAPAKQTTVPVKAPAVPVRPAVVMPVQTIPDAQASAMESCSRELKALRRLDARLYNRRKAQFDRLMSGASVYAGLRSDVAGGTREAVDAMYRFRTGKLCAEISRDVLDALARQGEGSLSGNGQ